MKSLALVGPFIVWLALAVPLNCHHGLTTPWAAAGHVHQAAAPDEALPVAPAAGDAESSGSAFCQHQGSSVTTLLAHAMVGSGPDPLSSQAALEPSQWLMFSSLLALQGLSLPPPERPPSHPA